MTDPAAPHDETIAEEPSSVDTSHVRGSTLLLVGRVLSIGINLVSQALIALCREALRIDTLFPEVGPVMARLTGLLGRRPAA